MDISIDFDYPSTVFSSGEIVAGSIIIYCSGTVSISRINASLIGESAITSTEKSGVLGSWKYPETHRIAHDVHTIIPVHQGKGNQNPDHLKLSFGYHHFRFFLQIPEVCQCSRCAPDSSMVPIVYDKHRSNHHPTQGLPPTMCNLIKGLDVLYRIDVSITSIRNLFKSTIRKSASINVWPIETQPQFDTSTLFSSLRCVKSVHASIMGPSSSLPSMPYSTEETYLISTFEEPAHVEITANLLPCFHLTAGASRSICMRLLVRRLNAFHHDLYLQSFQMLLVGYTDICCRNVQRTEMTCWTIQSKSNLHRRLFTVLDNGEAIEGDEVEIDQSLWTGYDLPSDAVPTFASCGLERRYELEMLMGYQCRRAKAGRMLFVQLRIPVRISSGIFPDEKRGKTEQSIDLTDDEVLMKY